MAGGVSPAKRTDGPRVLFVETAKDLLLAAFIFVPLERLLALRREQRIFRALWRLDLIHVFATGLFYRFGAVLLAILVGAPLRDFVPAAVHEAIAAQPLWIAVIEVIVIADLGFYFVHRAFHEIPWLWRFHAVHHSIEELDFLAAHRVHPLDQILTRAMTLLPVTALGFDSDALVVFAILYHWHSILLHANVRLPFGPLRWLIASPCFHHWHHADEVAARDRNYAGQLAILDVLFGTVHLPFGTMPRAYGTDTPVPRSYLGQLAFPFRHRAKAPETSAMGGAAAGDIGD
ncbi:MAG: sterol desaturase family protein [Alphaproteobacteria bacterium]|nr:MAG: sterol desaturase family protein [Alphaproteobacteria bacterium]